MEEKEKYCFPKECKKAKCEIYNSNIPKKQLAKLKSCPFCGAAAKLLDDQETDFWVACCSCEVNSKFYDTPEQAVKFWNKRALDSTYIGAEPILP